MHKKPIRKDWKEYEWGVIQIINEEIGDLNLRYNVRIGGRSNRKRQIDLLGFTDENGGALSEDADPNPKNFNIFDCKKRSRPVNIKEVEQFVGLVSDIGAKKGTIISSCGFSVGATQRAGIEKNILLRTITWKEAYATASTVPSPNGIPEWCGKCRYSEKDSALYGRILWFGVWGKELPSGVVAMFWVGECMKCEAHHLHCQVCGSTYHLRNDILQCPSCKYKYISFLEAKGLD